MSWLSRSLLYFRLIKELLRYDAIEAMLGFRGVHRGAQVRASRRRSNGSELETAVCEAVRRIVPFYWKRVQCLQSAVVTARVLRTYGTQADVVIGYRLAPFLAHAWVEVGGRIVNDSPTFQRRLQVLERF
jgi:Transglutaminase-like superfamily